MHFIWFSIINPWFDYIISNWADALPRLVYISIWDATMTIDSDYRMNMIYREMLLAWCHAESCRMMIDGADI